MDSTTPRQTPPTPTRRGLLTVGTTGLAATALLAACSNEGPKPGLSGKPPVTTLVPPTVPPKKPTQAQLQADLDMLATANSLELLAVEVYRQHGAKVETEDLSASIARFQDDHTAAAEVFGADVADHDGVGSPNEYLLTNMIDPMRSLLSSEVEVTNLFSTIESTLAATYIAAVGTMLEAEWRQTFAEHAAAAARRATVWGKGGAGSTPDTALFPMSDLIPVAAYLTTPAEGEAAEGEATEGDAPAGEGSETTEATETTEASE